LHSKVLEWRATFHYLAKFTKQCDQIVLNLLQSLIISSLKEFLKRFEIPSDLTDSVYHKQFQSLSLMRQQVRSKPKTTFVLSRYGPYENDNDSIPVADFEKMCFDVPVKSNKILKVVDYESYKPSSEQSDEVISLWKAELKCVCKNGKTIIKIIPSLDDFSLAVSKTISGFYKVVSNFTSLTCQDELLPYITQTKYDIVFDGNDYISEWPNIVMMKHQNTHYESAIQNLLHSTFEKSMELLEVCVSI